MYTITDTITPQVSYANILDKSRTMEVFQKTLSMLHINKTVKKKLIEEFAVLQNAFHDFTYIGDVHHYKPYLYKEVNEIGSALNLLDILSTEKFVEVSTKEIKKCIRIKVSGSDKIVPLDKYLSTVSTPTAAESDLRPPVDSPKPMRNILPALRGLWSFNQQRNLYRDTGELIAAMKKHLITYNHNTESYNDTISNLLPLIEQSKQDEKDSRQFNEIKSLSGRGGNHYHRSQYSIITITEMYNLIEYFEGKNGYQEKINDELNKNFFPRLIDSLSKYEDISKSYYSMDIQFKPNLDIEDAMMIIQKNEIYKQHCIGILNAEIIRFEKRKQELQTNIDHFSIPSREDRCQRAGYNGIVKPDQAYHREFDILKKSHKLYSKNIVLFESYIQQISLSGKNGNQGQSQNDIIGQNFSKS